VEIYLEKIRKLLKDKGFTYDTLAERTGKSRSTLINYLKGHTKIDLETFLQIIAVLDIKPADFFTDDSLKNYTENLQGDTETKIYLKELETKVRNLEKLLEEKERQIRLLQEMVELLKEKNG